MQERRYKQNIREKIAEINLELSVSREKCEFLISKGVILGDRENRERYDSIMAHCENLIKAKAYLVVLNEIEDLSY